MIAVGIATVKASLVALYFMHLRYDQPFYAIVLLTALLFLGDLPVDHVAGHVSVSAGRGKLAGDHGPLSLWERVRVRAGGATETTNAAVGYASSRRYFNVAVAGSR